MDHEDLTDVEPMPSTWIGPGRYEVIGTGRSVVVQKDGRRWSLIVDQQEYKSFATKREALQWCQCDTTL